MKELIELRKHTGKTTIAYVFSETPILEGTEPKNLLDLQIGNRTVSMLRRNLDPEFSTPELIGFDTSDNFSLADQYVFSMNMLQQRSLPVPQVARSISENQVVVSNVVANGGYIYDIKEQSMNRLYRANGRNAPLSGPDISFTQLDLGRFAHSSERIAQQASLHAIMLPDDSSFHIIFRPNKQWDIMILDIARMKIGMDTNVMNHHFLSNYGQDLQSFNDRIVQMWNRSAQTLQAALKK